MSNNFMVKLDLLPTSYIYKYDVTLHLIILPSN